MPQTTQRPPEISVLVPSRARPEAIRRLLASLDTQTLGRDRFEVIVGLDGDSPELHSGLQSDQHSELARIERFPQRGPAATRNALVHMARGQTVLFLNDDVIAEPTLLERHAAEHRTLMADGQRAMILGNAAWHVHSDDRLFDRLIRETSMVFFYDRMTTDDPGRDWGYRHAWTLNLSLPASLAREHGFNESLDRAMFEDLEWAWRVQRHTGTPVLYRPDASVTHVHRYEPRDYLARERELGRQAVRLAEVNGACAWEIFGSDLLHPGYVNDCRERIERDAASIEPLIDSFRALADMPSSAAGDPRLIKTLYEHHLPLKRHLWRHGLVEAFWSRGTAAA